MEKKLEELKKKYKQLEAREKMIDARIKETTRKARTRRLIQIGGAVESALGYEVEEKMLPGLIVFLKMQEERGAYVSKALGVENS